MEPVPQAKNALLASLQVGICSLAVRLIGCAPFPLGRILAEFLSFLRNYVLLGSSMAYRNDPSDEHLFSIRVRLYNNIFQRMGQL